MILKSRNRFKLLMLTASLCILSMLLFDTNHSAEQNEIQIMLDEEALTLDQQPIIRNGRTLVPLRGVFENMGADVGWNPTMKQVTAVKGNDTTIFLIIDNPHVQINQKTVTLDQPAIILDGRTMVPLRFISEALGAGVKWSNLEKTVYIESQPASDPPPVTTPVEPPAVENVLELEIGQDVSNLASYLGEPERIDQSPAGYEWWIYNDDPSHYFQLGVRNGQVVDIYTNAPLAYGDVTIRESTVSPSSSQDVVAEVPGGEITFHNQHEEKRLIKVAHPKTGHEEYLIYYIDTVDQNKITAIRKIKPELMSQNALFSWNASIYDRSAFTAATSANSTSADQGQITASMEKQVLDLANTARLKHGIDQLLQWNEAASVVARAHSEDMSENQYFSHQSQDGLSPFDRLENTGITYRRAGENIAFGYYDAIEVHHGWMNSPGHRKSILNEEFTTLGVGMFEKYYTQNFVTPR